MHIIWAQQEWVFQKKKNDDLGRGVISNCLLKLELNRRRKWMHRNIWELDQQWIFWSKFSWKGEHFKGNSKQFYRLLEWQPLLALMQNPLLWSYSFKENAPCIAPL